MPRILTGDAYANTIFSGSSYTDLEQTYVYAGAGNDTVFGGSGFDNLYGEGGDDYLEDSSGAGKLFGGDGNDILVAGAGQCTLDGGAGNDVFAFMNTSTGYHAVVGGGDFDRILAYTNNTKIGLKSISDIDLIDASGYSNVTIEANVTGAYLDFTNVVLNNIAAINGKDGADTIIGSAGDDFIFGGWVGVDVLNGGAGNDTLGGDNGSSLTGGSGADLFVFTGGTVKVTDFNAAEGDRMGLASGATWTATDVTGGARVAVTFSAGYTRSMTLMGITADQVDASWFRAV